MTIMHVEDNGITRASLANLVGVKNGRIEGHEYIATGIVAAAAERLSQGTVRALVLDIGLNVRWDNANMHRALRDLVTGPEFHGPREDPALVSHRLAVLARDQKVPCALLTNWPDYLKEEGGLTLKVLRDAFCAEVIFRKDEAGMSECAAWVRHYLV
jgi:hypothetical protein